MPTENLRFRDEALTFKVSDSAEEADAAVKKFSRFKYPAMSKTQVSLPVGHLGHRVPMELELEAHIQGV